MEERQRRLTGVKRLWLMMLDSAARASSEKPVSPAECLSIIRSPHIVKNERFLAAVHLIDYRIPGFARSCARALHDFSRLPLANQHLQMIGAGLGQNVYTFETPCGRVVLKIDRESQALPFVALLDEARRVRYEHEKIRSWYADIPGLIPHEHHLLVNGPLQGRRALATIQPFVAEPLRGVFEDFAGDALVNLLQAHPMLADCFTAFVERVSRIYRETGECIDLLGDRNLCVRGEENLTLYFVDAHDIYGPVRLSRYPERHGSIQDRIAYLQRAVGVVSPR
jgi:hypothetical protein